MTRREFNEYLHRYDVAGLSESETQRLTHLYREYPLPELVISSDLPRARQTAEIFSRGAKVICDPVLREIPLQVPDASTWFLNRRWPSEVWWSYLRSAWFFNNPPEGYRQSHQRGLKAVAEIVRQQQNVTALAVVSHSGFLLVAINLMMNQRLLAGRRLPHISFGQPTTYRWR